MTLASKDHYCHRNSESLKDPCWANKRFSKSSCSYLPTQQPLYHDTICPERAAVFSILRGQLKERPQSKKENPYRLSAEIFAD